MRKIVETVSLSTILAFAMMSNAHAYIDPGSGSVLTTAIIGFFAAIAYTFRKYFYKLKNLITGRSTSGKRR